MNTQRHPDQYCMLAVPFGDRPSGAIAIIAMHETAKMKIREFPQAANVITRNSYVDDILKSVPTLTEAKRLIHEIESILLDGGFKIKHWVISATDGEVDVDYADVNMVKLSEGTVLGMIWNPKDDVFNFKANSSDGVDEVKRLQTFTRRIALSQTSKLYDPLSLLSPFTLRAKLIMREICTMEGKNNLSNVSWDDPLPKYMNDKLDNFFGELLLVDSLSFHRSKNRRMQLTILS